jgi:hypothetical protein
MYDSSTNLTAQDYWNNQKNDFEEATTKNTKESLFSKIGKETAEVLNSLPIHDSNFSTAPILTPSTTGMKFYNGASFY